MRSLASRVALAAASSIAVAGVLLAVVGLLLDDALVREREDARLLDAAGTLAAELLEVGADARAVWEDETRELAGSGIRVAVFDGGARIAGDELTAPPAAGSCVSEGLLRACAVEVTGARLAVALRGQGELGEHRATLALSLALAVALTTLLGALGARSVARWSVAPLARLEERVARVDPNGASAPDLGPREGVAEIDALRDALTIAFGRLASALSHSRRFAGDAAHELRTPLTTVQAELELLAESLGDERDAAAVARARRTTGRLATLVERLLVLARPAGALEAVEPVDLVDVIEDVVGELPEPTRVRVTLACERRPPLLPGDAALLGAMIGCGLENALKFSGEGPVVIRVAAEDAASLVEIDDEGPGVPAAEREALFLPFHRSPSAREGGTPGHGIGLSLVAHVAALHGGTVSFVDGARGARLRIVLPRRA